MPDRYEVEQLVIDDSFINYCFRRNEADTAFWEGYLAAHPNEAHTIAEARDLVLSISLVITEEVSLTPERGKRDLRKVLAIAASVVVIGFSAFFLLKRNGHTPAIPDVPLQPNIFITAMAEKKTIRLPDSSVIILNAGSELRLDEDFGRHTRHVHLQGEALFDVKPNAEEPFVVKVEGYEVKVLGTVFNVKAYPGEKKSETSLISGKVEIYLPHMASAYKTLHPKEKFVIHKTLRPVAADALPEPSKTAILPLSYNRTNVNLETAWSRNHLVFENETFADIRGRLERWFDVQIVFEDPATAQYSFTANFEKENIEQVMKALQASYRFTYNMEGKTIRIGHQNPRQ